MILEMMRDKWLIFIFLAGRPSVSNSMPIERANLNIK